VPLSLLQLDRQADLAIIECGISLPGEMERLERIVQPDLGIFTNVGDAHLAGLGSRQVTAREKALLFKNIRSPGWVLLAPGESLALEALDEQIPVRFTEAEPPLAAALKDRALETDAAFLGNSRLAATAASLLGAERGAIQSGLARWRPAPMRLEISTTPRGILLINDAYTADPLSMETALATLAEERSEGIAVAVLGGMDQLGDARQPAHFDVGRRVAELGIDLLIGVGPGGSEIAQGARNAGMGPEKVREVATAQEAAVILEEHCSPGARVLLKGSRPERLESVAAVLFDAVAPARLYVDLDAVLENYRSIRQTVRRAAGQESGPGPRPERGVMAVVKSFGYGLDAVRIARPLERAGIEYLAVAYADEGSALRRQGITTPILVQNILELEAEKLVRHGLTAQVSSAEQIPWLEAEAKAQQRPLRVHLKVDTGMGRAGASLASTKSLAPRITASPWLLLEGLMPHFASADDPDQDAFTLRQIDRFEAVRQDLEKAGIRPRWIHACNSAGLARFPQAHGTMVRAGLGLLGYAVHDDSLPQRPALRLVTRVISIKEVPAGEAVGYGRTYQAEAGPRRLALVAVGYGDGYPWALSNRGWMSIHGQPCPVAGRVSMDVTSLDVTDLKLGTTHSASTRLASDLESETQLGSRDLVGDGVEGSEREVRPGDEVTVFGPADDEPSLLDLAELAGTIPYELLTRISARVRRIFRTSS